LSLNSVGFSLGVTRQFSGMEIEFIFKISFSKLVRKPALYFKDLKAETREA
jgi:hypothetical protein